MEILSINQSANLHEIYNRNKARIQTKSRTNELLMNEQKEEIEANLFALELLMPKKLFIAEIKKREKQSKDILIYQLAIKFTVSEDVIKTRMINLGILTSI